MTQPVFQIEDLVIDLYTEQVSVRAVDTASLSVMPGEILAIVGESGSGKTVMTLGPLGLLPEGVSVDIRGSAVCGGQSLLNRSDRVLAGNPRVLIADEPTTALDATVQAQILELIKDIQQQEDIAVVLITHDIGVVASVADRVAVLYTGRVVESSTVAQVLTAPVHPYTQGLLASVPNLRANSNEVPKGIPGSSPDQSRLRTGCPFDTRCSRMLPVCATQRPALIPVPEDGIHVTACHAAQAELESA
ncbi:ABC transporter ATP-binding protein (plasmid) [Ruegeria sp. SCSIO 43209]|uniref:oligopeptide/dipeptide ABC transporter ATP-binding protein n=1 Tax=Ruegeria sp. SCSIO 43209 TaxID=2793010 RepID=UPI001CA90049|nr:ABC transporter ATP-binding protein [Ruegeria sp. SCSIO 43209]UAB91473.1 ABC transporter ATP-binding protein [Ruegeria sp. SCSIO 43209]